MKLHAVIAAIALLLAGCVSRTEEELLYGRADCRRAEDSPQIAQQFQLDRQTCLARANVAAAGGAGATYRAGARGAAAHGHMLACMGERGYLYASRREHDQRCSVRRLLARP